MGVINNVKPKNTTASNSHLNYMAGKSFDVTNPIVALRMVAASSFFGEPKYYSVDEKAKTPRKTVDTGNKSTLSTSQIQHLREILNATDKQEWRSLKPAQLMEKLIDDALAFDFEATLQEAARLRKDDHIRTTPQVIMVRAANHPNGKGPKGHKSVNNPNGEAKVIPTTEISLIRLYAPDIIERADEVSVQLAYQLATYGKPIPASLRKSWRDALEHLDEYKLAKYRQEGHTVELADVVAVTHANSDAINKLMGPTKKVGGSLRTTGETWESIVSAKGSTKETWTEALGHMGHMALLRNLRNLAEKGVSTKLYADKLVEGAPTGKQLPFRYLSAYNAVENVKGVGPNLLDSIELAMKASMDNLPKFSGRTMSLCDNSGSAMGITTSSLGTMQVNEIANLTGVITAMQSDEGYVGVFGDDLIVRPIRKLESILTKTKELNNLANVVGQGTENGVWLFWDRAIKNKEHWDNVFIYSDMQAGTGGLYGTNPRAYAAYAWPGSTSHIDVAKLISEYRKQVNPNVMVYLVQVAGYQDTIVPEYYDRTFLIGGWSSGVLQFANAMTELYNQKAEEKASKQCPVQRPVQQPKQVATNQTKPKGEFAKHPKWTE